MSPLHRFLLPLLLLVSVAFTARAQTPTWTNLTHGLGANLNELNSVTFGNGLFVAIKTPLAGGTLHYATSPDGATWTARSVNTSIASAGGALRVRFLNGRFLVMPVGLNAAGAGVALALTSTDGVTWTSSTVGTTTTSPDEMAFGNDRVLAGGSNGYFVGSTNFTSWSPQSISLSGAFAIQDVAYGNGRWFVTTNGAGEVATSTDGVNFTKANGLTAPGGFRVEYGNNTWFFYSQADNAVSSDGVNFTTVTRTSTTPGGTSTIRSVNDRFLAYAGATFQSSTDGRTWTSFGATPSLGAGFVYTAIFDIAYGNGKYVAVGARDFPATSALIFTSTGATGDDSGGASASLTLAYQAGVTRLPGATAPSTGSIQGYAIHNGGVVVAVPDAAQATGTLLQHKGGALTVLRAAAAGMPGGGTVRFYEIASDGTTAFLTPRSTSVSSAWTGALLKLSGGAVTTELDNSNTLVNRGTFLTSDFQKPTAANGAVAFLGRKGSTEAYVFLRQNGVTTTVVDTAVTAQPNGTGDGKFSRIIDARLAGDGRIFFDGYNEGSFGSADFRRGLYAWQGGALSVVVDNQTSVPGTTTKFKFTSEVIFALSPDGTKAIVQGGNQDYSTETSERHGIYLHANGVLTRVADTTTTVDGERFTATLGDMAVTNDGTVFFYASAGLATNLYRARNGTVERFIDGGDTSATRAPQGAWIHQGQVFFRATSASLGEGLYRKPVEGGDTTTVLDFRTHATLKAVDARAFEDLQFAGDLALVRVGTFVSGIQRSAVLYGPASGFLGSSGAATSTPQSQAATAGGAITLSTAATGTVQWQRNGANVANGTSASLALSNVQPADAGVYSALVTNGGSTTTQSAIVGVSTSAKAIGSGSELAANIAHQNGNIFDQVQLSGAAATITADASQITRMSFVDLQNDIVQVEFSGAGTVTVVLDGPTGPATPVNYNQPTVSYMKGHASIVVTGANETTNLSVFSVGRNNAVNQALFRDDVTYDGMADIAFVAIHSANGKFGGLRTANGSYFATRGFTGVYAPGVEFTGPVFVGDINASDNATPVFVIGSSSDTRITGGDLAQANGRAVQVAGLTQLRFTANTNSHGIAQTAKNNQARLERDGTDVTTQIVVNP